MKDKTPPGQGFDWGWLGLTVIGLLTIAAVVWLAGQPR